VLDADADERPDIGLLLASGLHEQLIRPNAPLPDSETVDRVIAVLSDVEPRLADADAHLTAEALLATFLVIRVQLTGAADDLAAAERFLLHAAGDLRADSPQYQLVLSHLATAMVGLAHTGMVSSHFGLAIDLLRAAVREITDPELNAQLRAVLGLTLLQRDFDRRGADIREGLEQLKAAHEMAPPGSQTRIWIAQNLGSVLTGQFFLTGDRQQLQAARFYLDEGDRAYRDVLLANAPKVGMRVSDIPHLDALLAASHGVIAVAEALVGDAAAALEEAVSSFRTALGLLPAGHPHAVKVRGDLGLALVLRAMHEESAERSVAAAYAAADDLGAIARALPIGHQMRALAQFRAGTGLGFIGLQARDQKALRTGIGYLASLYGELSPGTETQIRCIASLGFLTAELYGLTWDAADREAALAWLERASVEFDRAPGHPNHAQLLSKLAQLHLASADPTAAIRTGLSALRVRVRDVLLQTGTANGLASAQIAAADAAEIAAWCLDQQDPGLAVQALELGRGLVLHAATVVTTLPDLLDAAGRDDLAEQWRDQASDTDSAVPWEGDSGPDSFRSLLAGAPLAAPSDLRNRTLAALAGAALGDLLSPPGNAQIAEALRLTGADALVYLLPPDGGRPGRALIVSADGTTPREIRLPELTASTEEVDEYLTAHAELLADRDRPLPALVRWRDALDALCAWAWPAVVERVLRAVPGDLPSVVLVPAGRLSLVPWHAARYRPAGSAGWRYAVADAVFSYAASGRQLVEISQRRALPLSASPVVLANKAIADCIYPSARYLGPGDAAAGCGTAAEVLAALPSVTGHGASMLHLACHAVADAAPGRSQFLLADGEVLMVETILRQASGRPPGAPGGLIDLVACDSDLATAHHDEALTLATSFLAAGACTVIAARWEIRVEHSSVLAFMFHHFLVRDGLRPRDALRQAQLWMLDERRPVPAEMPSELADLARQGRRLTGVPFWAAITHQGWLRLLELKCPDDH
jgi:hypothetical protein